MSTNHSFTVKTTKKDCGDRQASKEHEFEMFVPDEAVALEISFWEVQGDSVPICRAMDASANVIHSMLPRFSYDWDAIEFTSFDETAWRHGGEGDNVAQLLIRNNGHYQPPSTASESTQSQDAPESSSSTNCCSMM